MNTYEAVNQFKKQRGSLLVNEVDVMGQVTLEIRKENLVDTLSFFKEEIQPGYEVLMDLTGVDYLAPVERTKVVYRLHNPTNLERICIAIFVEREEAIPSVVDLWNGADWYERELFDMFGVHFEGHPDMKRILMPDDWIGHPLQRDYPLTEESVEFKHGVKPKIPSEIIDVKRNQKFL